MEIKHKYSLIAILALMMTMGTLPSDIYLPALPTISHVFNSDTTATQTTISVYLLALAISYFTFGPVIEKFGYKHIAIIGISSFIIATIGCALAQTLTQLIVLRTIQGFAVGMQSIVSRASVSKLFDRKEAARVFAITFPCIVLSPGIAPIIGGYLTTFFGWRSNFIFIAILAIVLLILILIMFRIPHEINTINSIHPVKIIKNYFHILGNKTFVAYLMITNAFYVIYFAYITESPFIFHNLNYSAAQMGHFYIWLALAFIIASFITRNKIKTVNGDKIINVGILVLACGVLSFIGTAFYGITNATEIIIPISIATAANAIIGTVAIANALALFPKQPAIATSMYMFCPLLTSGIAAKIIHPLVGDSTFGLALFMLASLAIGAVFYWLLKKEKT